MVDLGKTLARIPNCRIHGLMCIPPFGNTPEDTVPFFQEMAELMKQGRQAGLPWRELSMGMSADFPLAIQHGATWIRVGTALFGPRV